MGGPNDVTRHVLEGRWVLEGGGVLASPDGAQPGVTLEFRRRIAFHPHELQLGQISANNHWNLDVGVAAQALGWAEGRPEVISGAARFGINYNIFHVISFGLNGRGGYANVSNGDQSSGGLLWSAALRFAGVVNRMTVASEIGVMSLPTADDSGRDHGPYGAVTVGYIF
jgi:hypothetical protein